MKTQPIVLIFLGLFMAVSIPGRAQNQDKKHSADIAAIKQAAAELDAAYNRRDAEAFSKIFLEDADFQWHSGALLKNRKEIDEHFANAFKVMPADYRHITTFQRLRFLSPDIAIGDGTVVIAHAGVAEDEKPYFSFLFTIVGQKVKGQWKLAAVRLMFPKTE